MTDEERRAKNRAKSRRHYARNREAVLARQSEQRATPEGAFRRFMWLEQSKEQRAAYQQKYEAEHPRSGKRRGGGPSSLRSRRRERLARAKDKVAQQKRIIASAEAAIPKHIKPELRAEVRAMLIEKVYAFELPMRLTPEHAKQALSEHFRMFTKFGPESLDAPRFDDGRGSLHDTISEGLWQ